MRLRNAVYGVVDSKNDGPVGNCEQYLQLLPVLQKIFVLTNATSYVHLVDAEIAHWWDRLPYINAFVCMYK